MSVSKLGLLEGLLYSLGDEGIEINQLCELLELTPSQLKDLANEYERETLQIIFTVINAFLLQSQLCMNILKN